MSRPSTGAQGLLVLGSERIATFPLLAQERRPGFGRKEQPGNHDWSLRTIYVFRKRS